MLYDKVATNSILFENIFDLFLISETWIGKNQSVSVLSVYFTASFIAFL